MMLSPRAVCLLLALACSAPALALEPNEILVIANVDHPASTRLGRYYCQQRGVPAGHVVPVSLGPALRDTIGRADYEKRLARPTIISTDPVLMAAVGEESLVITISELTSEQRVECWILPSNPPPGSCDL